MLVRYVPFLLLCLVAGSTVGRPASADGYDEVERRLKTSGVGAPLAREISAAIRRGTDYLARRFEEGQVLPAQSGPATLATLALLHAGDPKSEALARKLFAKLRKKHWRNITSNTYSAAIGAMLLQILDPRGAALGKLGVSFGKGAKRDGGYWGYRPGGSGGRGNLSTAQFACLGMWAAERAGWPRQAEAWATHRRALVVSQGVDGSWSYTAGPAAKNPSFHHTYATGTCMGLADLVLARESAPGTGTAAARDWWASELAIHNGEAALARHVRWILREPLGDMGDAFPYYQLYALEKVCIFLDRDTVGGMPWYRDGARLLLAAQESDGSWSSDLRTSRRTVVGAWSHLVGDATTAFALLFLLRASETYRPTTPRVLPAEKPSAPVTPDFDSAPEPERAAPARPVAPPLPLVRSTLKRLDAQVDKLDERNARRVLKGLRFLDRALPELSKAATAGDTGAKEAIGSAYKILTRLMQPMARGRPVTEAWRVVLAIEALDLMPRVATDARALELLATIDRYILGRNAQRKLPIGYFHAAFEMLRTVLPRSAPLERVLIERALHVDPEVIAATIPALLCLERIGAAQPARAKQLAAKMVKPFVQLASPAKRPVAQRHLQWDVIQALRVLAPDISGEGGVLAVDPGSELARLRRRLRAIR